MGQGKEWVGGWILLGACWPAVLCVPKPQLMCSSCHCRCVPDTVCLLHTRTRSRTPQYVGTCVPRVACSNSSVPDGGGRVQVAYSCAAPGVPSPSPACGDLCDSQNTCAALCECGASCGTAQVRRACARLAGV